jgi:hypothetical protein
VLAIAARRACAWLAARRLHEERSNSSFACIARHGIA